jgi:hypothetical protein
VKNVIGAAQHCPVVASVRCELAIILRTRSRKSEAGKPQAYP